MHQEVIPYLPYPHRESWISRHSRAAELLTCEVLAYADVDEQALHTLSFEELYAAANHEDPTARAAWLLYKFTGNFPDWYVGDRPEEGRAERESNLESLLPDPKSMDLAAALAALNVLDNYRQRLRRRIKKASVPTA